MPLLYDNFFDDVCLTIAIFTSPISQTQTSTTALAATSSDNALATRGGGLGGIDIPLLLYFLFWYVGNYYYNIVS